MNWVNASGKDAFFETSHEKADVLRALHASKCAYADTRAAFTAGRADVLTLGLFDDVIPSAAECKSPHVIAFDSTCRLMVVAFRGTDFSKVEDVKCNLNVLVRSDQHAGFNGQHAGFSHRAEEADLPALLQTAAARSVKAILFTGHSLGGAAAICAAVWALHEKFRGLPLLSDISLRCVTFAAPYALTDAAASFVSHRLRAAHAFLNIVNEYDIVPHLMALVNVAASAAISTAVGTMVGSLAPPGGLCAAFLGAVVAEVVQRMLVTHLWTRIGTTAWLRFDFAASHVSVSLTTDGVKDGWQQLLNNNFTSLNLGNIYQHHTLDQHEFQLKSAGGGLSKLVFTPAAAAIAPPPPPSPVTHASGIDGTIRTQSGVAVRESPVRTGSALTRGEELKSPNLFFQLLAESRVTMVEIESKSTVAQEMLRSLGETRIVHVPTGLIKTIWVTFVDYDGVVRRVLLLTTYVVEDRQRKGTYRVWEHKSSALFDRLVNAAKEALVAVPGNPGVLIAPSAKAKL